MFSPSWPRNAVCAAAVLLAAPGALVRAEPENPPPPAKTIAQADEAMKAGDYDKALQAYAEAARVLPDSQHVAFNQGVAHYRRHEFDKAAEMFSRAMAGPERSLDARAKFNLGDCAYATALEKKAEPEAAINHLKSALGLYRDALKLNPADRDARANIETAARLLKQLQEEQKQQQQQQDQKDKQDDKDKNKEDQKENPSSQPSSQPQDQQDKKDDKDTQDKKDQNQADQKDKKSGTEDSQEKKDKQQQANQDDKKLDKKKQQDKPDEQTEPRETRPGQMTREQAEKLLQLVRDKERQRREQQAKAQAIRVVPVDKDW